MDLLGGVGRILLRVLVALLGRGVAVVQIARAGVVAGGLRRALVLHVLRDGLHRDLVSSVNHRLATRSAIGAGGNRLRQPGQLGYRELPVPDVLSVSVAAAAAVKNKLVPRPYEGVGNAIDGRGDGHDLVQIEADLPCAAAAAAGKGQRVRKLKAGWLP